MEEETINLILRKLLRILLQIVLRFDFYFQESPPVEPILHTGEDMDEFMAKLGEYNWANETLVMNMAQPAKKKGKKRAASKGKKGGKNLRKNIQNVIEVFNILYFLFIITDGSVDVFVTGFVTCIIDFLIRSKVFSF